MSKHRVAITVILDPMEAQSAEEAEHLALNWVRDTLSESESIPESVSKAIGNGDYDALLCLIRGSVPSETSD